MLLLVARLLEGGGGGSGVASGCRCCCCCRGRLRVVATAVMMVRDGGVYWLRCCLWVLVLLAGGSGGACGLWRCPWVVVVVVVISRMQDELLSWLLLHCHAVPTRLLPLSLLYPPPPSVQAVPSLALLVPAVLLRSSGAPLVRKKSRAPAIKVQLILFYNSCRY